MVNEQLMSFFVSSKPASWVRGVRSHKREQEKKFLLHCHTYFTLRNILVFLVLWHCIFLVFWICSLYVFCGLCCLIERPPDILFRTKNYTLTLTFNPTLLRLASCPNEALKVTNRSASTSISCHRDCSQGSAMCVCERVCNVCMNCLD